MIIFNHPEAVYHADRSTLSSTGAKTLLRSPRQFRYQLDNPKRISAGPLGTLTHALVFDTPHNIVVKDWDARTKEGKLAQARADEKGTEFVSKADWDLAHDMATAVLKHPRARLLIRGGNAEVSMYGDDPETGVAMRGRLDYWRDGEIVDLKTTQDASPAGFARAVATYKYHVQDVWYEDLAALNGFAAPSFTFVVVEKEPPHLIGVYALDENALAAGATLADRARQVYRDCLEAEATFGPDAWPEWGRPGEPVETLNLPRWALTEVDDPAWL